MTTLKRHNREDIDSDSYSEHEYYHMENVSLDLEDINAVKPLDCLLCTDLHKNVKMLTN